MGIIRVLSRFFSNGCGAIIVRDVNKFAFVTGLGWSL
jgi:hypothetical protein